MDIYWKKGRVLTSSIREFTDAVCLVVGDVAVGILTAGFVWDTGDVLLAIGTGKGVGTLTTRRLCYVLVGKGSAALS